MMIMGITQQGRLSLIFLERFQAGHVVYSPVYASSGKLILFPYLDEQTRSFATNPNFVQTQQQRPPFLP